MLKILRQTNQYLDYCRNICQMSPNTLLNKKAILNQFIREIKIADIKDLTNQIYDKWLKMQFANSTSPSSINIYNSTIFGFLRFHQNAGVEIAFNFNLVPHLKSTKSTRKFYTTSDIMQVLNHADETEKLMIEIMFETGMRIAEIVDLKVENLDGTKINFVGKGAKMREVYLNKKTWANIQKYLEKYHIDEGYIWCVLNGAKTLNGEPPSIHTIRKRLRQAFANAGYKGFYPHALRHSFATNLQQKGANLPEIKEMMGHSSIATTERYLHGFDGRLEELFRKYQ